MQKPALISPDSRGDVDLDPFQLDALRELLFEHEMRIKAHFDRRMEQFHFPKEELKASTDKVGISGARVSPDAQLGLKAGVAPHLIQLIDRVKASNDNQVVFNPQASYASFAQVSWKSAFDSGMAYYEYFVDFLVVVYALTLGLQIHYTSVSRAEPPWVRTSDIAFCAFFTVDLLIRICTERKRFCTGSQRWWNLADSFSLSMMIIALVEGSRALGNLSSMIRVGRVLRLARCLWTFKSALAKWTHISGLRVLLTSMIESIKVMLWMVLLVLAFVYVYSLVLTESIWDTCTDDEMSLVCARFGNVLSSMMTLYQIMYSGLLWGDLWNEVRFMAWYIQGVFLSYIGFALMVLVNTVTSFICSLQSTVSKREREVLIDNEMDYNERLVRQLYVIFKDFDQNGNGAISWAEFQLALEDERMHAFLHALELDMSDAVKVFQILASEKTGAIEESDFLLGCLRLRGGATAVDMVRMQMEQEWMRGALLQLKDLMQKTLRDLSIVQQTVEQKTESTQKSPKTKKATKNTGIPIKATKNEGRSNPTSEGESDSSDEPIHVYQRTELKAFERAVTLEQLNIINQDLERCSRGWVDAMTGEAISVEDVNLYQFSYHYILPQTAPREGLVLQWPASALEQDLVQVGAEVVQRSAEMRLPRATGKVLAVQMESENGRATLNVTIRLIRGQFSLQNESVHIGEEIVLSAESMTVATVRNSISYKELLSPEVCSPVWYCSHWWGEPIRSFVQCCQQHAILRRLGALGSYWVCGYANRQHELDMDIGEDVSTTSFSEALSASRGLLLILDEKATPFSRIWCDFEVYSAVMNPNMELDIAASINIDGKGLDAKILTKFMVPGESAVAKSAREQDFPIFLLDQGLGVCLEKGNTTQETDKTNIFKAIAESRDLQSEEGQLRLHRNLVRANQTLHSTLAILAWPQAMHKNLLPTRHAKGLRPGTLNVCEALFNDTFREFLNLSLAHFDESCTDSVVKSLAESLPLSLLKLKLSFEGCSRLTDLSLQALSTAFAQLKLKELFLDFVGCRNLTDAGLRLLAAALHKSNLVELELHFAGCMRLHVPGIMALKENLPSSLRTFKGSFKGTSINRNFRDLNEFEEFKVKGKRPSMFLSNQNHL